MLSQVGLTAKELTARWAAIEAAGGGGQTVINSTVVSDCVAVIYMVAVWHWRRGEWQKLISKLSCLGWQLAIGIPRLVPATV